MSDSLISPYGGKLVHLLADDAEELLRASAAWPSWDLTPRQLCDLELLLSGGFSPLDRFLGRQDFESVCRHMRLADGTLWPIPVSLDVTPELGRRLSPGCTLALRDPEGTLLAALHVDETWEIDRRAKAESVYGTLDPTHPGVAHLFERVNDIGVGGRLEGVQVPTHHDFRGLRLGPAALRALFQRLGWSRIVGFQTRNPMHRAHFALTARAARQVGGQILLHPAVGMTRPGDVDHYTRVRCYEAILKYYPADSVQLALLPVAMRMGGPREALLHGIVRRNHGCSHFVVGRDHAGPGLDGSGRPFYAPYAAQELFERHEAELGIQMVPFQDFVYVPEKDDYLPRDEVPEGCTALALSGTELRRRLATGAELPNWFTFPEVAEELRRTYPPRGRAGCCVFFTGLSGAGKSTVANVLLVKLMELGGRRVTLLDGDLVRKHLSSGLGFTREDRDLNIRRIGFVASEIVKNGGVAICAPIAPYDRVRREVRELVEPLGGFVLVHLSTPLEVCERRDRKGLYSKARAGLIENFTGVSDPYEPPRDAELVFDTTEISAEQAAERILLFLEAEGYLRRRGRGP